jgi:hypothetical protein
MPKITLKGGTHDGMVCEVNWWQDMLYMTKRITIEEASKLKITETVSWKPPEEVYQRVSKNVFEYARTVVYNANEC